MVDLTLVVATALPFAERDSGNGLGSLVNTATILAVIVAAAVVGLIVPTLTGGRTPGKLLFGLSTSLEDGGRPSIKHHALRTAGAVADLMPGVVPGLTGFAVAASSPRRQRLGDRLAGTTVIDLTVSENSDPADSDFADNDFADGDPADGDFADNELNQPAESADNPDTRPEFPAAVSSSEVVNVNSADNSTPDTLSPEQEPEQEAAVETIETVIDENLDRAPDPEWAEGPISTFSAAEVTEAATETVTLHVGPSAEEPDANQGLKAQDRAESTSAEDEDSAQTRLADTTRSRLVESASVDQSPGATAYPLPSHRQATKPAVAAGEDNGEGTTQEPQELQPIGETQPVEEPSVEESQTEERLPQAPLAEEISDQEEISNQEETAEQEVLAEAAPEPSEDQQADLETSQVAVAASGDVESVDEVSEHQAEVGAAEAVVAAESNSAEDANGQGVAAEVETVDAESPDEEHNADVQAVETDEAVEQTAAVAEADADDSPAISQSAQDGEADPAVPVWSEDWNAWICWNDAEQAWLRYDSAIGEWLSMEAAAAEL